VRANDFVVLEGAVPFVSPIVVAKLLLEKLVADLAVLRQSVIDYRHRHRKSRAFAAMGGSDGALTSAYSIKSFAGFSGRSKV